ncbi:MAG: histidine phosphatase family protein [Myxococcota bacterium]
MDDRELLLPWTHARTERSVVLLLVRHGQTEWNATNRFLGSSDIPLNSVGRAQAAQLSTSLPGALAGVYSSPLSRALDTARSVHDAPVVESALAELHQGELEGLTAAQAISRHPTFFQQWAVDPGPAQVPGGETLLDLVARVMPRLQALACAHEPGQVIGVFSHQMVISTATCTVREHPLTRWRDHRVGNAQATALAWREGRFAVLGQRLAFFEEVRDA